MNQIYASLATLQLRSDIIKLKNKLISLVNDFNSIQLSKTYIDSLTVATNNDVYALNVFKKG